MPCPSIGTKWFWTVQIILVGSKLLWSGPHNLGQVEIRLFWANFYSLDLSKMIWNRPKQIGTVITIGTYSTEIIWTVKNHFGPVEGQGINRRACGHGDVGTCPHQVLAEFNKKSKFNSVSIPKLFQGQSNDKFKFKVLLN